ncbi:MAG: mannitol dehydrogenase family protein [Candidatus Nanopelagicales bacterium]
MTPLTGTNLPIIMSVPTPTYDRATATVGIVHFGFGNFHRSHEAMYVDRLMESGRGMDWGICGVGVLPQDARMRDVMSAQDYLYTLVLRHPDGSLEPRVIGSVLEYLFAPDDPEAVFARAADPAVRMVSLTVTEGGYLKNPATGEFDPQHPSVLHDLADPSHPQTAFTYVIESLRRRRAAGVPPFTVLSCDNLQGNGDIARQTIVSLARLMDPELGDWIDAEVAFPNSMVDRITPATTDDDRTAVRDEFSIDDAWPVPGEPFTQWIVEDHFTLGRPEWEAVGVQFVDDVRPYELMKLRLLNASHQAIAYLGGPLGYVLVDEAMRDVAIRHYLMAYMVREATPTLGELPGIDLPAYIDTLIERFSNPHMRDTLVRLATDGSNRMATFTLPTIRENLAAGRSVALGAAMVAAWSYYWELIGSGMITAPEIPEDVLAQVMTDAALAETTDPGAFLAIEPIFGDLASDPVFREEYLGCRETLRRVGVHGLVQSVLA